MAFTTAPPCFPVAPVTRIFLGAICAVFSCDEFLLKGIASREACKVYLNSFVQQRHRLRHHSVAERSSFCSLVRSTYRPGLL